MSTHSSHAAAGLNAEELTRIEVLLDELGLRAKSPVLATEFHRLLLARLVPALGATAAAIWMRSIDNGLCVACQHGVERNASFNSRERIAERYSTVVEALQTRLPRQVQLTGTGSTLICYPLACDGRQSGAIELIVPTIEKDCASSHVQVLEAVAELLEDFHRRRELDELRTTSKEWQQYEQFSLRAHRSLNLEATAYDIANEARRVVGCDRVSLLVRRGKQMRATAISGVDRIERRAKSVRALEQLATRAARAGEPVWYHDGTADLPDQIAQPLDRYLEESHARTLALVPLYAPSDGDESSVPPRCIGVLIAETFQAGPTPELLRQRMVAVTGHTSIALHNSITHSRLPLSSLGHLLSKIRWLAEPHQLPKTVAAVAILAGVIATLVLVPADFNIEARGDLQPLLRRDVFASDDGVVSELVVDSNRAVTAGEPLVILRKSELDLEARRVLGEIQTAEKKLAAIRAERLHNQYREDERKRDPHELAAEEEELKSTLEGLAIQQAIVDQQLHDLTIRSPINGQTITWNLEQLLAARPVQRGQALLSVADLTGPWVLELHVADDRAGHVLAARDELKPELEVRFVLTSNPGHEYQGRVKSVAPATEVDAKQEPTMLVTVAFDKTDIPALRPGATAIAKIQCGRRSLGYVWLHDLYDYLQSLWW